MSVGYGYTTVWKPMDLMQNYPKLFKIINFKGAGGPMFKTCQCAPYIAVITISEFEPHSRFQMYGE